VFSSSARTCGKATRSWLLDPEGWQTTARDPDGEPTIRVKTKLVKRRVPWVTPEGCQVHKLVDEQLIARWSVDYARRDAATRADMIAKATVLAASPAAWTASNRRGVNKYIKPEMVDPATGELIDHKPDVLSVDTDRAEADQLLDGYWLVHTSETSSPPGRILEQYKELWRIEETFKVTKTDLKARPVYVWNPAHIEAHFTICFLALLITRLLQAATGLPTGGLLEALRGANAHLAGQGVYLMSRPKTWDMIDQATGVPLDQQWATIEQLRAWRRNLTQAAKRLATHR